jgi:hypothetical protein
MIWHDSVGGKDGRYLQKYAYPKFPLMADAGSFNFL